MVGDIGYGRFNKNYPAGSGIRKTKNVANPRRSSNLITSGTIAAVSPTDSTSPSGWISTASTTASITDPQQEEIVIGGTPTSGFYNVELEDSSGRKLVTAPIPFDSAASVVQIAIQNLSGYEDTTVSFVSGTTPNYTFNVTFNNRQNGVTLTVANNTNTGTFTITNQETGGDFLSGGRALLLTGDGTEEVTYYIPVTLVPRTSYFFSVRLKPITVTSGVLAVSLVDGFAATTVPMQDNSSNNNQITQDISSLTNATWDSVDGFFRTPSEINAQNYLKFEFTTALDASATLSISDLLLKSTTPVYPGGPYVEIVDGDTAWAKDDRGAITVSNNYGGQIHQWLDRIFGLRSIGRLLPTSGSPTRPDSLIS